jgi:Spy/CpxP family protein refolding chaperone
MKKLFLLLIVAAMAVTSAVAQQKETKPAPAQKDVKPATEQKDVKPSADQKDVTPATEQKDAKPSADQMKQDRAAWEKKFKEDLKLTTEQSDKYDALSKEYSEKINAIVNDASLDKDAQKEKKMGLKKEKEAKFLEILTPEQQAKYKELKESMEKKNAPAKEQ